MLQTLVSKSASVDPITSNPVKKLYIVVQYKRAKTDMQISTAKLKLMERWNATKSKPSPNVSPVNSGMEDNDSNKVFEPDAYGEDPEASDEDEKSVGSDAGESDVQTPPNIL